MPSIDPENKRSQPLEGDDSLEQQDKQPVELPQMSVSPVQRLEEESFREEGFQREADEHLDTEEEIDDEPVFVEKGTFRGWLKAAGWVLKQSISGNYLGFFGKAACDVFENLAPYGVALGFGLCAKAVMDGTPLAVPATILAVSIAGISFDKLHSTLFNFINDLKQFRNVNKAYLHGVTNRSVAELESEDIKKAQTVSGDNFGSVTNTIPNLVSATSATASLAVAAGSVWYATGQWWMAGIVLAPMVPRLFVMHRFADDMVEVEKDLADVQRRFNHLDWNFVQNDPMIELKSIQQCDQMIDHLFELYDEIGERQLKAHVKNYRELMPVEVLETGAMVGGFGFLLYGLGNGSIAFAEVMLPFYALLEFRNNSDDVGENAYTLLRDSRFVQYIHRHITEHSSDESYDPSSALVDWGKGPPDVVFDNVSLTYPGDDEPTIHDISTTIKGGSVIGIVGPNGAGKSTFIKSLTLEYGVSEGEIRAGDDKDSINVEGIKGEWRTHVRQLRQEPILFEALNFRQLLEMGINPFGTQYTFDDIVQINEQMNLDETLKKLPAGYETINGTGYEGKCKKLSGGQAQRVAAARTVLGDPDILVLDEPTANLDVDVARSVRDLIKLNRGKRTIVIVTHDPGQLCEIEADWVISIEDGTISEQGTVSDLLDNSDGYFSRAFHDRKASYSDNGRVYDESAGTSTHRWVDVLTEWYDNDANHHQEEGIEERPEQ